MFCSVVPLINFCTFLLLIYSLSPNGKKYLVSLDGMVLSLNEKEKKNRNFQEGWGGVEGMKDNMQRKKWGG